MSRELRVALCQMTSVDDLQTNVQQMKDLMAQVPKDSGVRLFCFPENCLYMRLKEGEKIHPFSLQDEVFVELVELAKSRNAYLHLGSIPLGRNGALYNSSVIVSDDGDVISSYQKIHLFDIHLEGQKPFRESDVFTHGKDLGLFEIDGWKLAQSICYDIRFAELYASYARQHVDVILIPAAFLVKTGEAHWEVLLRARAIESQCYVVASAQAGTHHGLNGGERKTFGNSMVVEPWGTVAQRMDPTNKGVTICTLEKSKIEHVRTQIPMSQHRRVPMK